jgi:tetratricopeptide (TPR) repeat protein
MREYLRRLGLITTLVLVSSPGFPQPPPPDPVQAAFAEMMARPGDPDAAVRYARAAAAAGQVRPAIAALERVLRVNPRLDNIRLELASLYLAAGAPDLAALYAEQALASPSIPPEVAERARGLLAQAETGAARSFFTGSVFVGGRYDTDANQATSLATISVFSPQLGVIPVQTPVRAQGSPSFVANAQFSHRYDLGLQREGSWETNLAAFNQTFSNVPADYNLISSTLDTGPRIGIGEIGDGSVALRPFFSGSYLTYATHSYAWLYGGGLSAYYTLPPRWTLELTGTGGYANYVNSAFRPTVSGYSGDNWTILAAPTYTFSPGTFLTGAVFYYDSGAQQPFFARRGPGAYVSIATEVPVYGYTMGVSARAGARHLSYGAPDPFLDPTQSQKDWIIEAGLSLVFPITTRVAAVAQYGYIRENSNYPIYQFDDHAVTVGLRLGF